MNNQIKIEAQGLTKKFNRAILFRGLGFSLVPGRSLAVTGPNGSGKSTLLEITALLRRPTLGGVAYSINGVPAQSGDVRSIIGFSSPKINPYGDLTGIENIAFASAGDNFSDAEKLLRKFNLYRDRDKMVKYYSSGMRQRIRFLLAVINNPPVLILDEPGANMDRQGRDIIHEFIDSVKSDRIIIIATNDDEEAALCGERIQLGV